MGVYSAGSLVRLSVTFTDANGAVVDPATVSLKYQVSPAAAVTKTYPANVIRDAAGAYHFDVDTTGMSGSIQWEWVATGSGQSSVVGETVIRPLPVA